MDEKVDRLTNIKAIGWTTLIIFGITTLWIAFQIIGTVVFDNSIGMIAGQEEFKEAATEMKNTINQMRAILFIIGGLTLLTTIGSLGLLKLRNWGLILYQSLTIVIIISLLSGLVYYVYSLKTQMGQQSIHALDFGMTEDFKAAQKYKIIEYGTFLLLFSWMLTRANIFLSKSDNRREFQ